MLKIPTLAACALAMSGSLALAQTASQYMPPGGAYEAPYGTNGSAPLRDVGSPSANANDTAGGGTRSTTILKQEIKNESAAGMPQSYGQAPVGATRSYAPYGTQQAYGGTGYGTNPNRVCITDEYGYKYNCRGDRIGAARR
jgi:hypothetical protein